MSDRRDAPAATSTLTSGLRAYLRKQLDTRLEVADLRRLAGGASHETWAFDVVFVDDPRPPLALVLRRNFCHDLIESKLETEYALLEALYHLGQPVPRPRAIGSEIEDMGPPFMIVERAAGTDLRKALADSAASPDRKQLAHTLVAQQAAIHAIPWRTALGEIVSAPHDPSAHELERWVATINKLPAAASPLLTAAIAWLRAHPPAAREPYLVHGDFKTNNLVWSDAGGVTILDWEMAHLGDPVEDIAWTMLWDTRDDLVGGLLSRADYLAAYAEASGSAVEPERLFFWEVFALVKLAAIFIAGITPAGDDAPPRPMLVMLGRALPWIDAQLAARLSSTLTNRTAA